MNASRLVWVYLVIGVLALGLTWAHLPPYLGAGVLAGNVQFWNDAVMNTNAASLFLLVDLFFLVLAANIWMVVESRRHHIPFVWVYILVGILIGISFAFPLFLAAREKRLENVSSGLTKIDGLLLSVLSVGTLAVAVWVL